MLKLVSVACILAIGAGGAWASIPSHTGSNDPTIEGFNHWGGVSVGPDAGPPASWYINDNSTGDGGDYYKGFSAADLPADWQFEVNVKASDVTWSQADDAQFAIRDGSNYWMFNLYIPDNGPVGRLFYGAGTGGWIPLMEIPSGADGFLSWKIEKRQSDSFATIYLNGVSQATLDESQVPVCSDYVIDFGSWSAGGQGKTMWSKVAVKPIPIGGDLSGQLRLEDFNGDLSLAPIRIDLTPQGSGTAKSQEVKLTSNPENYLVKDIAPGTYDVSFSTSQCLRTVVTGVVITLGETTTLGDVALSSGDTDGDNEVTSGDLSIVLRNIDKTGNP